MKGLFIRDYYTLKAYMKQCFLVTAGVVLVAVLFFISSRHGNIAKAIVSMEQEGEMAAKEFYALIKVSVNMILLIPLAYMETGITCFHADEEAHFSKVLYSLPVTDKEIVGSRYLSNLFFAVVSLVGAILAGICVCLTSDYFKVTEIMGNIITIFSLLLIYTSANLVLAYLVGYKIAGNIMVGILMGIWILCIPLVAQLSEEKMMKLVRELPSLMQEKCGIFLLVAIGVCVISYFVSLRIVEKKGGVA